MLNLLTLQLTKRFWKDFIWNTHLQNRLRKECLQKKHELCMSIMMLSSFQSSKLLWISLDILWRLAFLWHRGSFKVIFNFSLWSSSKIRMIEWHSLKQMTSLKESIFSIIFVKILGMNRKWCCGLLVIIRYLKWWSGDFNCNRPKRPSKK